MPINKYYLKAAMTLSILGILAFSGCSSIEGTAESQQVTKNRTASYLEQSHQADPDPDAYQWFY